MNGTDLEAVYKSALPNGHVAALRAVYTCGWFSGNGSSPVTGASADPSKSDPPPPLTTVSFVASKCKNNDRDR